MNHASSELKNSPCGHLVLSDEGAWAFVPDPLPRHLDLTSSLLASDGHVSASTQNQALNALLFLHREVLYKEIGYVNGAVQAKRPKRLPVVLTRQAVRSILGHLQGLDWIMAMLLYGAGLRLLECLRVRR